MEEDTQDSRTSLAGRKRGFEETATDKRIHKHPRQESSYESDTPRSPLTAFEKSEVAKPAPEHDASPSSPIIEYRSAMNSLLFDPTETEYALQPNAQIAAGPYTKPSWNSGVQKGLRTSFSSKKARSQQMTLQSERNEVASPERPAVRDVEADVQEIPANVEASCLPVEQDMSGEHEPISEQSVDTSLDADLPVDGGSKKRRSKTSMNPRRRQDKHERKDGQDNDEAVAGDQSDQSRKANSEIGEAARNKVSTSAKAAAPFKKMHQKELAKLSDEARSVYKRARRAHQAEQAKVKVKDVKSKTAEAARAMEEYGWPLPDTHKKLINAINLGQTYYPRKFDEVCRYSKGKLNLSMGIVLDSSGLPVQLFDISFNEWAVQILIENPDTWTKLANLSDALFRAFGMYMAKFYSTQSMDDGEWKQKLKDMTSTALGAWTAGQALREAKKKVDANSFPQAKSVEKTPSVAIPQKKESSESRPNDEDIIMISDDEPSKSEGSSSMSDKEDSRTTMTAEEILLQQKYYPSSSATSIEDRVCLACSQVGHLSTECPALKCADCGGKHSTIRCPEQQMCQKCHGRGHAKADCPEKLTAPRSELQCQFCEKMDHSGSECHTIWRSFFPLPKEMQKVQHIAIDCYTCGASNHFGPACGLRTAPLLTGGFTWSTANLNRYVDPASKNRAVSAGTDYSLPPKKGFSIKGKANDPYVVDDSSDDEQSFIRPKIQTAERGHIRFGEREDNRPKHNLPRRPPSPVAPYRNPYDGGFGNGEEPRAYGRPPRPSDHDYYHETERFQHPMMSFRSGGSGRNKNTDKPATRGGGGRGKRGGRGGRGAPRH